MTQQLENEIRFLGVEPAGPVALGFPPSIGILFVGKAAITVLSALPTYQTYAARRLLSCGSRFSACRRLDIGIMSCEAQHPELICQPLFSESMWLIGRPGDWRFTGDVINPKDLDKIPLLVGSFMHTLLQKRVDRFDMKLTIVAEADSLSLARKRYARTQDFSLRFPLSIEK
jgi:LysR family nitrogen assimilation transcriptional regulator